MSKNKRTVYSQVVTERNMGKRTGTTLVALLFTFQMMVYWMLFWFDVFGKSVNLVISTIAMLAMYTLLLQLTTFKIMNGVAVMSELKRLF